MAEATQATTTATETLTATVSDASAAPINGAADATVTPKDGASESTATVGKKGPSALERAAAALEKHEADAKAKPADEPKEEAAKPEAGVDEKAEAKPDNPADKAEEAKPEAEKKEDDKKVEPRIAKGLALLAEREERARTIEKRAATMIKEAETKAAAITAKYGQNIAIVETVLGHISKGDHLAAVEALGIDLPRAVELMSRKVEPSAEDIQRKIVREEFEAREKMRAEAEAKAKAEAAERAAATEKVRQTEFLDKVFTLRDGKYVTAIDMTPYKFVAHRNLNGDQLWNVARLLASADHLPPEVQQALKSPSPMPQPTGNGEPPPTVSQ